MALLCLTVEGSKRYRDPSVYLSQPYKRVAAMCGLRTRPRTDVDPPPVELQSTGGISSRRPRGDNLVKLWFFSSPSDFILAWRC